MVLMARIIAVISGKGGVGKTTVTLNLAAALVKKFGRRVTVVDCNITTSHLGLHLGMYYHPINLNKVLKEEAHINDAIHEHHTGLRIVPASLSLSDLKGVDMTKIREKIESLQNHSDIIILDSGPGLGREAMSCLRAAEEVIYVTTPYIPAVMDIVRCKEVVNELGLKELGLVVNMRERDRHEMSRQEIEQLTRLPIIVEVPHDKVVKRAIAEKLPSVLYKPHAKSSKVFFKLAASIAGEKYLYTNPIRDVLNKLSIRIFG
jgi:cell division ATPase MinD